MDPGARIISGSGTASTLSAAAKASAAGTALYADGAVAPGVNLGASAVLRAQSTWQAQVAQRRAAMGTS